MDTNFSKYGDMELYSLLGGKKAIAESAFAELYARYSQRIFAFCLRLTGSHEDASDAFQETFLKFYHTTKTTAVVDNISAYLYTIARNICINSKRDDHITIRLEDYNLKSNDVGYEQKELLQLVARALEVLDFDAREAFILRQFQGLSYNEISLIVGDTETAVKNRVWRAKEKLKSILTPYLADLSK